MYAKFLKSAMKAIKTPGIVENLGEFHHALVLHLMFLDASFEDGTLIHDYDISFREATRKYITFLQTLDVNIELPKKTLPAMTVTFDKDCDFSKARPRPSRE